VKISDQLGAAVEPFDLGSCLLGWQGVVDVARRCAVDAVEMLVPPSRFPAKSGRVSSSSGFEVAGGLAFP
jgi:hypothetical protein